MKRCPKCNREFDDELRFCLEDGTALVGDEIPSTVAAPTMVLPTSPETPPTMTQAARADVPSLGHLTATRMATDDRAASINSPGASRTVIIIGVGLVMGLLLILVGLGTSDIFYFRRTPMILLCLFGMVLAMIRAKRHSTASLMVGISLGFYLLETFVISTVNYSMPANGACRLGIHPLDPLPNCDANRLFRLCRGDRPFDRGRFCGAQSAF